MTTFSGAGPLKLLHNPDLGLLLMRIGIGIVGVYHGSQKVVGAFGGSGMNGFAGFLGSMNVPMPTVSAWLAALAELVGGLLVGIGLFPRLAAIPFAFTMLVAFFTAHHHSFDMKTGGSDYPFLLAMILIGIVFTGAGRYSVMGMMGGRPALRAT